jgi:hypothetical protein
MTAKRKQGGRGLLRDFLARNGLKPADAAKALSVSKAAVSHWLHGTEPGEKSRELIETWTCGEVPRGSWGALTDRRRKRRAVVPFQATGTDAS